MDNLDDIISEAEFRVGEKIHDAIDEIVEQKKKIPLNESVRSVGLYKSFTYLEYQLANVYKELMDK